VLTAGALATAFSQVDSPLSVFCHISPVTLSVIVVFPLSAKDCALMA